MRYTICAAKQVVSLPTAAQRRSKLQAGALVCARILLLFSGWLGWRLSGIVELVAYWLAVYLISLWSVYLRARNQDRRTRVCLILPHRMHSDLAVPNVPGRTVFRSEKARSAHTRGESGCVTGV